MPVYQAEHLIDAYKAYRSEGHRPAKQQLPGVVSGDQFEAERKTVLTTWQQSAGSRRKSVASRPSSLCCPIKLFFIRLCSVGACLQAKRFDPA